MYEYLEKLPPNSIEAEISLLGSMIIAGSRQVCLIGDVMAVVTSPDDFDKPIHQDIYKAICGVYDKHGSMDNVQLIEWLKNAGLLEKCGGADYLVQLAESVPVPDNALFYAKIVRDTALRRRLIYSLTDGLKTAHNTESIDEAIDIVGSEIIKLSDLGDDEEAPEDMGQVMQRQYETLVKYHEEGKTITGIPTGIARLDERLTGFHGGEMIVVAARPSMGKSALAVNFATHMTVREKLPIAFISMEMTKAEIANRMMSSIGRVDSQRMRRNMLNEDEFVRLQEAVSTVLEAQNRFFIYSVKSLTSLKLRAKARSMFKKHGIQCVFVDYLQLMHETGYNSRYVEVGAISRGIKSLAMELDIPVVAVAQLNRRPEDRSDYKPKMSDLRESGNIEQDADVILMLHREAYYHRQDQEWKDSNPDKLCEAEIIVEKQRNGPPGTEKAHFDDRFGLFSNFYGG